MKKVILTLLLVAGLSAACDNDSTPAPNEDTCNYDGLTYTLNQNASTQTLVPDSQLSVQLFTGNNGPDGQPGVEIVENQNFSFFFTSAVIHEGQSGPGRIVLNGTDTYQVTVTCQRAGTQAGQEFRLDVTGNGIEAEFCVQIDQVL